MLRAVQQRLGDFSFSRRSPSAEIGRRASRQTPIRQLLGPTYSLKRGLVLSRQPDAWYDGSVFGETECYHPRGAVKPDLIGRHRAGSLSAEKEKSMKGKRSAVKSKRGRGRPAKQTLAVMRGSSRHAPTHDRETRLSFA